MIKKLLLLAAASGSSYLFIKLLPVTVPLSISVVILELILDPLHYFLAMVVFFLAFLSYSLLIKMLIEGTHALIKKQNVHWGELIVSYGSLISFYVLLQLAVWPTLIILSFSIIYGIISIDLSKHHAVDTNY